MIGESGKRGLRTYVQLFLAIGRANNLTCDIARDSSRVYAFGFDTDIDMVQTLYASLVVQMVRASDAYIKSGDYAAELVTKRVRSPVRPATGRCRPDYELVDRPVHATTARINFQQAFAGPDRRTADGRTAGSRAADGRRNCRRRTRSGVALVLRDKEVELVDHYKANSTARGIVGRRPGDVRVLRAVAAGRRSGGSAGQAGRRTGRSAGSGRGSAAG